MALYPAGWQDCHFLEEVCCVGIAAGAAKLKACSQKLGQHLSIFQQLLSKCMFSIF